MALSETALGMFRETAAERVGAKFQPRGFIDDYAAMPEFAGQQAASALDDIPSAPAGMRNAELMDAFYGEAILLLTKAQLRELIGEDRHIDRTASAGGPTDDWKKSLRPEDAPKDEDIGRAARGGDLGRVDRAIERESTKADDVVRESFQEGLLKKDEPKGADSGAPGGGSEGDDMDELEAAPDFTKLDPASCFRAAVRYFVDGILVKATGGPGLPRLRPLIAEGAMTVGIAMNDVRQIRDLAKKLRWRGGDGPVNR